MSVNCKIIDRECETQFLFNDIKDATKFTINILYARTAVGKSSVTDKLSGLLKDDNKQFVVIRNNPVNSSVLQEWTVLYTIFYELKESFKNNPLLSYFNYVKSNSVLRSIKREKQFAAINSTTHNNPMASMLLLATYESDGFAERMLVENEQLNIYGMQNYVRFILANTEMVLIIDNLQIIDRSTLEFLNRTVKFYSYKKHYIIFEYTLQDSEDTEMVQKINEYFSHENILSLTTFIENTDEKYIPDIIDQKISAKPKSYHFNKDMVNHYLSQNTGNIRELIDYSLSYNPAEKSGNNNKTIQNILALNEGELFVLYCVLEFNGKIEKAKLLALCKHNNLSGGELSQSLITKNFLKGNDQLEFDHASIADALKAENVILKGASISTEKAIKDYVESLMSKDIRNILPFLNVILNIYYKSYPSKLQNLLDIIESSVFINIQPTLALVYLKTFFDIAIQNVKNYYETLFKILRLCFKFELYNDGYDCLCRLGTELDIDATPVFHVYKMMYLAALDRHSENIRYYNAVINKITDKKIELNLHLTVLSSYRSTGDIASCLKIHKLLNKKEYRNFPEYGYRLRLVDMYLSRRKSIPYIKKSIAFFNKIGNIEQAAKSRITYTHLLGGLGKIKQAVKQIEMAKGILADKILGQHMLLVNRAVLYLVDGNFTQRVYDLLDLAESSTIVPFDKLAVIVNKLVWCYENGRFDLVHSLKNDAEKLLIAEPDRHIHCLYYYNMYACCIKENNTHEAYLYLDEAKKIQKYCIPVHNRLNNIHSRETQFILKKPWHICYLTYWTYNILFE